MFEEYKMVLVVRRDLHMRRGKEWAQIGHAVHALYADHVCGNYNGVNEGWILDCGSKKVGLYCNDERDLLRIKDLAEALDIPYHLVTDTGKTEFGGVPTNTVIGLGPYKSDVIDQITGPNGEVKCKLA